MLRRINRYFLKIYDKYDAKKDYLIKTYREHDEYNLNVEVFEKVSISVPKKLPSEPEGGVMYHFGPTGYFGDISSDICLIPIEWRNVNNYCHWTLAEIPLLYLAFKSPASTLMIPKVILDADKSFQRRWLQLFKKLYPEKKLIPNMKGKFPQNYFIPVNHDTSNSDIQIGKTSYKHYHHSRATPYTIKIMNDVKPCFNKSTIGKFERIYINRKTRRLKNEIAVQKFLKNEGYSIIELEEFSLDDQVKFFSEANEIIGFHGAGLTNLLFCSKNANIIEIVDKDCVYPSYLDGLVIPGKKATRTYFHMIAHMKKLNYQVVESDDYFLKIEKLEVALYKIRQINNTVK